jgi:hypothetical protein
MAQKTDDRRPLTAGVRVRCRPSQCRICGDKSGLGHVCSEHSRYPTSLSSEGHTDEAWEPSRHCSFGYRGALVRRVLYCCCVVMRTAGTRRRAVCSNDSTASITRNLIQYTLSRTPSMKLAPIEPLAHFSLPPTSNRAGGTHCATHGHHLSTVLVICSSHPFATWVADHEATVLGLCPDTTVPIATCNTYRFP